MSLQSLKKNPSNTRRPSFREVTPWWVGPVFLALAAALVPWIVYLAFTLPGRTETSHYRTAWVGFDVLLVMALSRTAWLTIKGKRQVVLPAVMSATLLVVDAWFDITTAKAGTPRMEAIVLAVLVELPAAALALYLSRHVERFVNSTLVGIVTDDDET